MQIYNQNGPKLNGVYSRNSLSKISNKSWRVGSVGIHWISLNVDVDNVKYFESFVVEYIPKEIKKLLKNIIKNIITSIYRTQTCNSVMSQYFCIGFIDFLLKGKPFLTNFIFPTEYGKDNKIILKYFQ